MTMNLLGVTAHGVELAESLSALLQRHGYIGQEPADLDELLVAARHATANPGIPLGNITPLDRNPD